MSVSVALALVKLEPASVPANSGNTSYQVFPYHFPGVFITVSITWAAGQQLSISEISLGYEIGKEVMTV